MRTIAKPAIYPCIDSVGGRVVPEHWALVVTPHRAATVHTPTGRVHIIYGRPAADDSHDLRRLFGYPGLDPTDPRRI